MKTLHGGPLDGHEIPDHSAALLIMEPEGEGDTLFYKQDETGIHRWRQHMVMKNGVLYDFVGTASSEVTITIGGSCDPDRHEGAADVDAAISFTDLTKD